MLKIFKLTLLLFIFCLAGCGGGTIGTGNHERVYTISGTVTDAEGKPLEGIEVSTETSPDSSVTDNQGRFQLVSEKTEADEIIFSLKGSSFYAEAILNIPDSEENEIPVTIKVNQITGIVISVSIKSQQPEQNPSQNETASQTYLGRFTGSSGKGISAVKVTEIKSRKSAISQKDGRFSIKTSDSFGKVKFNVRYKGLSGSFSLNNVPKNVKLEFTIRLSIEEALIDPDSGETKRVLNLEVIK